MKIAFIGAGSIAPAHLEALRSLGAEVAAVVTRGESGKQFAQKYSVENYFSNTEDMVKKVKVDAAFLLTHPDAFPKILSVLKPLDVPVFLEKPVAMTCNEAELLRPLLPKTTFVGLNRRFYGNVTSILPIIRKLPPFLAQLTIPERAKDYRELSQRDRDHWHMLNGIHCVDLVSFLAGHPTTFSSQSAWGKLEHSSLPQFTTSTYETDLGNRVVFSSNYDSPGGWRINIFTNEKEFIISPIEKTSIKSLSGVEELPANEDDKAGKPGFIAQARTFLEGVKNPSKLPENWVSFESAVRSMKTTDRLFRF